MDNLAVSELCMSQARDTIVAYLTLTLDPPSSLLLFVLFIANHAILLDLLHDLHR